LPGLFYRRSGAPQLAVSIATGSALCWEIQIASVSTTDVVDTKNCEAMAAVCNQAAANSLAQSPLDGFWLHKRF
jgi:lauroyl/myristoyl acyltransferase